MKKLIKPKSRERMRSLTLTPSHSEFGDAFPTLPMDSQDSSSVGSGSNSLDDTLQQKNSISEYKLQLSLKVSERLARGGRKADHSSSTLKHPACVGLYILSDC